MNINDSFYIKVFFKLKFDIIIIIYDDIYMSDFTRVLDNFWHRAKERI